MAKLHLFLLILIFATLTSTAQDVTVKIQRFEINNRRIKPSFEVFAYADEEEFKLHQVNGGFVVPESLNGKPIAIRFVWGKYDLFFSPIYPAKLTTSWIIGVDTKPFDPNMVYQGETKNLLAVHYIRFVSTKGDDTELIVPLKKRRSKR